MQGSPSRDDEVTASVEVKPVVRVTSIGRTPPGRHEPRGPELPEVVRDEVLGLPHYPSELTDPPVAPRQLAENCPAHRVADKLQELERRFVGSAHDHGEDDRSREIDTSISFDASPEGWRRTRESPPS
jgi:hypothetical protein